jgi:hypothetical protein
MIWWGLLLSFEEITFFRLRFVLIYTFMLNIVITDGYVLIKTPNSFMLSKIDSSKNFSTYFANTFPKKEIYLHLM